MYKNKAADGLNNICGARIRKLRKKMEGQPSQRAFADMLQRVGLDVDKNAIQRIECRQRFVTDIELKVISEVLGVTCDELLTDSDPF